MNNQQQLPTTTQQTQQNGGYVQQQPVQQNGYVQQQGYVQPQPVQQNGYVQPTMPQMYNMNGQPIGGYQNNPNNGHPLHQSMLTADDIAFLNEKINPLDLAVSHRENIVCRCDHTEHTPNGPVLLTNLNADGTVTCSRCGSRFRMEQGLTKEEVQRRVDALVDVVETTKMMAPNMPVEAARQYFQILALVKKLPHLFEYSATNYHNLEKVKVQQYDNNAGNMNLFNQITGGWTNQTVGGWNNAYQQPVQQYNQQQTQMTYQQPVQQNGYTQPQQQQYQQPVQQQSNIPNNGFSYVPNGTDVNNVPTGQVQTQAVQQQPTQTQLQAEYSAPQVNAAPEVNTPKDAKKTTKKK